LRSYLIALIGVRRYINDLHPDIVHRHSFSVKICAGLRCAPAQTVFRECAGCAGGISEAGSRQQQPEHFAPAVALSRSAKRQNWNAA
jgi:hypothetical protein